MKSKNQLTLPSHFITQQTESVMPLLSKISATRYCGVKGGIIHG